MIKRQKKQSFNSQYLLVSLLIIPLIGFFAYAIFIQTAFFLYLEVTLAISFVILIAFHLRFIKKQAEIDLQKQDYAEKINLLEAGIAKETQAIESFRKKIINYLQLKNLTEQLSVSFTLEDTSKTLSAQVNNLFMSKGTTVILYLFHSKTGELGISASQRGQMQINVRAKKGDMYDQWVVQTMKPLLVEDIKSDFRFDVDKIVTGDSRTIRSLMSVPLVVGTKAVGILRVDNPREEIFSTEDIRLLTTIGDLGAVAIENAQLYERIEDLATHDSLTGLYLRRYLLENLSQEASRALRRKKNLSFIMIDLDNFKHYNDRFGHTAGDIVLRTVGLLLEDFFNEPGSLVCRYGGEEFSVLLPDCSKEKALELAQTIRKKIESQTIILRREKTRITVSIGIATFPKDAQIKEELIQQADKALYEAKRKGRNRVCTV